MSDYRIIAGAGAPISGEATGSAAPGQPTILDVFQVDTTPDADGNPQKRITVSYLPPDPLGTFSGVHVYLDAPDTAGALTIADGTTPADGTSPESGAFEPADIGFFGYDESSPQLTFNYPAPSEQEFWRVYLVGGSDRRTSRPIQAGLSGASESKQFVVLPPAAPFSGREFAPLVTDVELVDPEDLDWDSNPLQPTTEGGQRVWRVAVQWAWPEGDQNFQALGGVNIILDDGTTQTYIGNVNKTAAGRASRRGGQALTTPLWISGPLDLRPGTTEYTVYLISYDTKASNNSLRDGVTPSVTFDVTRQLGAAGEEYCAQVTSDGSHDFVTAVPIAGADGTSLLRVTGYWSAPSDPQFGGAEIVVKKPDGNYYTVAAGRLSPIEADISQPASVQSWRFYLRSVDVNGRRNSIVDNGDGTFDTGETPWVDVSVGNADGQLNLAKARSDMFSSQFAISAGALVINQISASLINTGILQVGGGGSKASIIKIFDTLGSLIGWAGDDTATSGYVGGWYKQFRIGGTSPATAQVVADSSGNVTISGSLIVGAVASATTATSATSASTVPATGVTGTLPASQVGSGYAASALAGLIANSQLNTGIDLSKLASGTLPVGVVYTGTVVASNILAGTISAAITMTSPNITSTDAFGNYTNISGGKLTCGGVDTMSLDTNGISITPLIAGISTYLLNGGLQVKDFGVTKADFGLFGSDGGAKFNGSHYALWTASNKKKLVGGAAFFSSGSKAISTGLSSIDFAIATPLPGTTPTEYIGTGSPSGGSITFYSSNAGSSGFFNWVAVGTA